MQFRKDAQQVSRQNPQNRSVYELVKVLKKITVFAGVFPPFLGKIPLKLIIRYLRLEYGLSTHFKYPEFRGFTYNLLNIRHNKIGESEYQQISKIEYALSISMAKEQA